MASFLVGMMMGIYTAGLLREEYYFPTSDKIKQAVEIYQKNNLAIQQAKKETEASTPNIEKKSIVDSIPKI
jgi:hypothetical protein